MLLTKQIASICILFLLSSFALHAQVILRKYNSSSVYKIPHNTRIVIKVSDKYAALYTELLKPGNMVSARLLTNKDSMLLLDNNYQINYNHAEWIHARKTGYYIKLGLIACPFILTGFISYFAIIENGNIMVIPSLALGTFNYFGLAGIISAVKLNRNTKYAYDWEIK